MPNITLREIDKTNYRVIGRLSHTLSPEQQTWVAHNAMSMMDAHYGFGDDRVKLTVRGIYADDEPVGLVLWGSFPEGFPAVTDQTGVQWWVVRLMTAAAHQGKGYGRAAMQYIIDDVRSRGAEALYISFVPGNDVARKLYESLGFVDTGEVDDGEVVYRLDLKAT